MGPALPATNLANLLTLPARHFAAIDAGQQRTRILHAAVSRGQPRILRTEVVDAHEEGFTTEEEMREEVRRRLQDAAPDALILVAPQHRVLRHLLEVPPGDPAQTRAAVEREASHIGLLSDSAWAFDAVRLPDGPHGAATVAAAFCRQHDLNALLAAFPEDDLHVFDVVPAGDALGAAFLTAQAAVRDAILVDIGAGHTAVVLLSDGRVVSGSSFPSGSNAFTSAIAAGKSISPEAAELLKRSDPPSADGPDSPLAAAARSWLSELDRTVGEWATDNPAQATAVQDWPVHLAGGGALQPRLAETLASLSRHHFLPWPQPPRYPDLPADFAAAWGSLLLALGLAGPAPSLLPTDRRQFWGRQRLWRALLSANLMLAAMLAVALVAATLNQTRRLAEKDAWKQRASTALQHARDLRTVAEALNSRMDDLRPVLERQRQTVETLQILSVLQQQRTNAQHWYVALGDAASYAATSNNFPPPAPPPRPGEPRSNPQTSPPTNTPPQGRAFVAEVCLLPQGEAMRQTLSDLVGDLKRFPLFRNVDVLPAERRRDLVPTNLVFPERHFALELNLSETELLPPLPLPTIAPTNREPRSGFRIPVRPDSTPAPTNGSTRNGRPR